MLKISSIIPINTTDMVFQKLFYFFLIFNYSVFVYASGEGYFYIVKKNENLSKIMLKTKLLPLYSKKGSIQRIALFNQLNLKKSNQLKVGSRLYFPLDDVEKMRQAGALHLLNSSENINQQAQLVEKLSQKNEIKPIESPPILINSLSNFQDGNGYSNLGFSLFREFNNFSGNRENGTRQKKSDDFYSSSSWGWIVNWKQQWTEQIVSKIFIAQHRMQLQSENKNTLLSNEKIVLSDLGFGYGQYLQQKYLISLNLEFNQNIFYRNQYESDFNHLEIITLPIMKLRSSLKYFFNEDQPIKFSSEVGAVFYGSSGYDNFTIQSGFGYDIHLKINQKLHSLDEVSCQVYLENRNQNTSLVQIEQKNIGTNCGYEWSFQ